MSDNRFSEALLDEIKGAVPITSVLGQHIIWDKEKSVPGRRDMWACCPFHGEKSPSFHAEDDKGAYHCFGCGVSGDHYKFLKELLGMTFPEAVEAVAEMAGISLPDSSSGSPRAPRQQYNQPSPPPPDRAEPAPPPSVEGKRKTVATYDYSDRDGNVVYQVCRRQIELPDGSFQRTKNGKGTWKTFQQRRPSGLTDRSWIWGLSAGEFMRPAAGKDWSAFDKERFSGWPNGERRQFDTDLKHTIYRHPAVEIGIFEGKTIWIAEGEKDVHTLESFGFVATTNSGGGKHWSAHLAEIFRGADVVVLIDNDEAGRAREDLLGRSLRGIAARLRVLDLSQYVPTLKESGDVTDWAEEHDGTADKLVEIAGTVPDWRPAPPATKFGAVGLHELHQKHLQHEYVIDGFLERKGVALMPGASGSGKSFVIIEMGMCLALGWPFWDMKVKQGLVIYQAGEGQEGVAKRLEGWMKDRGVSDPSAIPFVYLPRKINLYIDDKDTDEFIAECKAWSEYWGQPIRMVVIDTLNKAMTGANENAGQDMGKVISRAERIRDELDCAVVIPHHKSAQGTMRGHTSLTGDVSNVINVTELTIRDRNDRTIRTVALDKNKDGEKGRPLRFVLRQVVLDVDGEGKARTTCVVDRPDGDENVLAEQGRLTLNQAIVLRTLRDSIDIEGEDPPPELKTVPVGKHVVAYSKFLARLRMTWAFSDPETEIEKRNAELKRVLQDAGKRLQLSGYIDRDNDRGLVWWTGKSDRPAPKAGAPRTPVSSVPADVRKEISEMGVPF
jgi:5S rRNA maturation endonuclease (ribonuclease M5)